MTAESSMEACRRALLAKRQALSAGLAAPGEVSLNLSEDDQPQAYQHEAVTIGLNSLGYTQLRLIQEALDRLAAGDFGACLSCDGRIPPRRLAAVPWARYCVPCQERIDAANIAAPDWQDGEDRDFQTARRV